MFFLQLIYELQQMVGGTIREIFEKNWITICAKLSVEEGGSSFEKDLKALKILEKNIFHKPPPQDVVEVTPVSYALVLECYRYSASDS